MTSGIEAPYPEGDIRGQAEPDRRLEGIKADIEAARVARSIQGLEPFGG